MLHKTHMNCAKLVTTPMAVSSKLSLTDSLDFEDPTLYRSIIGCLQYLSLTRPNVAYAIKKFFQFIHTPKVPHWQAVKRILRYLKHTAHLGLSIQPCSSYSLHTFTDVEWAEYPNDRRSTGGFYLYLGSNLVSWGSKRQYTIAQSSTEAEYKALANTTAKLIRFQSLPPTLWCHNLGVTYLSVNPIMHSCTKHIEVNFHFIWDWVASKS